PEPLAGLEFDFLDTPKLKFLAVFTHIDSALFAIAAQQRDKIFLWTFGNGINLVCRKASHLGLFRNNSDSQAGHITLRHPSGCPSRVVCDKCTPLNHFPSQRTVLFHLLPYIGSKGPDFGMCRSHR